MIREKLKKLFFFIILFCTIIFANGYFYNKFGIGIPCIINKTFGVYCAGCGMTRAAISLLKLDFYQAIRYNAFSVILLPAVGIVFCIEAYCWVLNRKTIINNKVLLALFITFLVAMCVYGVLRNIDYFSYLAPTKII